jgi:hypothetical protein
MSVVDAEIQMGNMTFEVADDDEDTIARILLREANDEETAG